MSTAWALQLTETFEERAERNSAQIDLTLQRGAAPHSERRFAQVWESDSIRMTSKSRFDAKDRAHLIASSSTWTRERERERERVLFTFLVLI